MKTVDIALMTSIWSFFLFAGILLPPWYLEYWKKDLEHAGKYLALDHLKTYVKKFTAVYSIIGFLYISIVLAIFRLVYVTYRSSKKETQKLPSREPSLIPLRTQHVQYSTLNTLNVSRHSSIYSCNLSI
ncbi:hypothetical protein Ddc_18159 [Ditylenchus destructor]|nr:hypothetical protein Ddc_18159 [Ditylenchus destructor]